MAEKRQVVLDIQVRSKEAEKRLAEINTELILNRKNQSELTKAIRNGADADGKKSKELTELKIKTAELSKEERSLTRQITNTTKATNEAEGSNEQLRVQLSLLNAEYDSLSRAERDTTKRGKELQIQTRKLSDELKKNESAVGNNRRNVGNYTQSIKNAALSILSGAGLVFGVQSLGRALVKVIGIFKGFDQGLATLQAISGASAEQLKLLEADAQRLGETTQFTAQQVVELQTNFARVGFNPTQILAATEATLNLAIATGEDLAAASDVAAATLGGYQLEATETARVTDVMAASFNSSALNLEKFRESTKLVAPIAASLNIEIEDVTGALGELADAGLSGSIAGTGLRNVLLELGNENSELAKRVGFGVKSSEDFQKALQILSEQGINATEALELVDKRALPTFLTLINGADSVEKLSDSFRNAAGSAKEAADIVGDTLQGDLLRSQSALEGLAIKIGQSLEPALRAVIVGFTSIISALIKLPEFIDENKVQIGLLATGLIALNFQQVVAAANALRLAASQKRATIETYRQAVAQRLLNFTMSANPIGIVIAVIASLAAAFFTLYQRSETLRAGVAGTFEAIKTVANNFLTGLVSQLTGVGNVLAGVFTLDLDRIKQGLNEFKDGYIKSTIGIAEGAGEAFSQAYNDKIAEENRKRAAEGDGEITAAAVSSAEDEALAEKRARAAAASEAAINAEAAKKRSEEQAKARAAAEKAAADRAKAEAEAEAKRLSDLKAGIEARIAEEKIGLIRIEQDRLISDERREQLSIERQKRLIDLQKQLALAGLDEESAQARLIVAEAEAEIAQIQIDADNKVLETKLDNAQKERDAITANAAAEAAAADASVALTIETEKKKREAAEAEAALERDLNQQKIALAGQTFEAAADLLGEQSALGKAAAIAASTIATYQAANQALATPPGPPYTIPLVALTIAAGLKNVAEIAGVQFAEGGYTGDGFGSPDSSGFKPAGIVHAGEYVVPARVLAKPAAQTMVKRLEGMRGYADGGFVGVTAQARQVEEQVNQSNDIVRALLSAPAPVVDVREINTVQRRVSVKQTTGNL